MRITNVNRKIMKKDVRRDIVVLRWLTEAMKTLQRTDYGETNGKEDRKYSA
jgi:hypothetical protein